MAPPFFFARRLSIVQNDGSNMNVFLSVKKFVFF